MAIEAQKVFEKLCLRLDCLELNVDFKLTLLLSWVEELNQMIFIKQNLHIFHTTEMTGRKKHIIFYLV